MDKETQTRELSRFPRSKEPLWAEEGFEAVILGSSAQQKRLENSFHSGGPIAKPWRQPRDSRLSDAVHLLEF